MKFATGTTVKDFGWYRRWLSAAEDAGFSMITTGDSQSLWADPFVIMTVAAQHTARPRLGITVSNPVTRHPAVVASSLVALQQLSAGRMVFGVSSGDSALRNIGVRPATVAEVRDFVVAVKGLCAGEKVEWQGQSLVLRWGTYPTPVWMAAEGPRMQFAAGQVADGVVLSNALDTEVLRIARENIAAGAASAGRHVDDVEIWCMAAMSPAPTEAEGIRKLQFLLAGTANHVYRFHTEGKGLPEELRPAILELQNRYDSSAHATPERAEANARLVDELGLVDFLARRSVIAGPVERQIERLQEIDRLGATNLILSQFVDDQIGFMRDFARLVAPNFE
jgi:5,10-methylenetetrahydromethanopterin reductase